MINKKSLWFLTLFSLILVLSIYYITMPSELLLSSTTDKKTKTTNEATPTVSTEESDMLVALRVEHDESISKEIDKFQTIISDANSSVDDKNKAYDQIKNLNNIKGEEEKLEKQIKDTYKFNSFVKIADNNIEVVVNSKKHNENIANNIIRTIQSNYEEYKYITIKFQK